jgi:plastocyanin
MRFPVLLVALVCGLTALGAPVAVADTGGPSVPIYAAAYGASKVDVLAGDTVTWRNDSVRPHTVSAADGSFASARLTARGSFSHRFDAAGVVAYYCQIHPFMRAEVDVHRLLLEAPRDAAAPGRPLSLSGRAALPAGAVVSIQAAGGAEVASATVESGGRFHATVAPRATTTYMAVSGADASPAVQVLVVDRKVKASAHGRVVRARVLPGSPGATVVLQLHLRERFGWWPVRHAKLDKHSRARFSLRLEHKVRARVVLTAADGVTPLARSGVIRLTPR